MQGALLLIIAIAAITKIIRDMLKIRNLGTVPELGPVRGGAAEIASAAGGRRDGAARRHIKKGARQSAVLSASLSGSPKGGGGLLSHLVGQYHRRGRA